MSDTSTTSALGDGRQRRGHADDDADAALADPSDRRREAARARRAADAAEDAPSRRRPSERAAPPSRRRGGRAVEEPSDEDPFAGWPQAAAPTVIEDVPDEGASVEHVAGEIDVPDGYTVLEGTPSGHRRSVAVVVSRFNGGLTNRMLARRARRARGGRRRPRRGHDHAGAGRVRAAARGDGAREDAPLRLRRRARRDRARRDAALRLRRRRGGVGPPARGDRDRRPGRVRRAHRRHGRAGARRGSTAPPTRCARRSRWPTCSRSSAPAPRS